MSLPTPTELSEFAHNYEQLQNNPTNQHTKYDINIIIIISLLLIIMLLSYIIYNLVESNNYLGKQIIQHEFNVQNELNNDNQDLKNTTPDKIEKLTTGDLFTMNLSTFAEPFDDNDLPSGLSYRDDFITPLKNTQPNTETFNAGS